MHCVVFFTNMNPQLAITSSMILSGASGCGKSFWILKLISEANNIIIPQPERIIYCYAEYQPMFDDFTNVQFIEGLPEMNLFDGKQPTLLVLDDLMSATNDNVSDLFTRISHHHNVFVVYITQNLFHKSKQNRTMSLNAQYIVIFKSPRDATQVATLGRQMYPGKSKFLIEAFTDATQKPYGYLFSDMKPETEEIYRVRTNIFPDERQYVYLPK